MDYEASQTSDTAELDPHAPETAEPRTGPPWERRREIGWLRAFGGTTRRVLFRPHDTFSHAQTQGIGSALLYAIICAMIGSVLSGLMQRLWWDMLVDAGFTPGGAPRLNPIGIVVGAFIGVTLLLSFLSVFYHVILMLVGGNRRGFAATFRVFAYASGAVMLIAWVPVVGWVLAPFWVTYLYIVGVHRLHGISGFRAALVVLMPLLFFLIFTTLAAFGLMGWLSTIGGGDPNTIEI